MCLTRHANFIYTNTYTALMGISVGVRGKQKRDTGVQIQLSYKEIAFPYVIIMHQYGGIAEVTKKKTALQKKKGK